MVDYLVFGGVMAAASERYFNQPATVRGLSYLVDAMLYFRGSSHAPVPFK